VPPVRDPIAPRISKPSPYADKVKQLTQQAEDQRKLAEYVIEPDIKQWKALGLAAQGLKMLAVISIFAWLLYPWFVWWHAKTVASDLSQMMGVSPFQMPSLSALPMSRTLRLEMFGGCLLAGVFNFVGFWVASDLLLLLVRLEQNTTRVVSLLRDRR
jgi:hypothetical protein